MPSCSDDLVIEDRAKLVLDTFYELEYEACVVSLLDDTSLNNGADSPSYCPDDFHEAIQWTTLESFGGAILLAAESQYPSVTEAWHELLVQFSDIAPPLDRYFPRLTDQTEHPANHTRWGWLTTFDDELGMLVEALRYLCAHSTSLQSAADDLIAMAELCDQGRQLRLGKEYSWWSEQFAPTEIVRPGP